MTKKILDEFKARLVELDTDSGNVSEDSDAPPPLVTDVSSNEGEDEDSTITNKGMMMCYVMCLSFVTSHPHMQVRAKKTPIM